LLPAWRIWRAGLDFSNLKVSMPNDPWEEVLGTANGVIPSSGGGAAGVAAAAGLLSSSGDSGVVTAKLALSPRASAGLACAPSFTHG
jgi:hypothetical protein